MKLPPVKTKTAVITGCSSGIGRAAAEQMRANGWRVIATARKPDDVSMLEKLGFEAVSLDMADDASVWHAAEKIKALLGDGIGALVNNAGFGQVGAIEDLSRDMMNYQFQVNVIGMQHLTNLLLPAMRTQGYGRIINISSVLGRISMPYLGIYSASKFAMESMSDALRVELAGSGIGVIIIEPGPIKTAFGENASAHAGKTLNAATTPHRAFYERELVRRAQQRNKPEFMALPPEAVAKKILRAAEHPRPRRRYTVTVHARAGDLLARFAPAALLDAILARRVGK